MPITSIPSVSFINLGAYHIFNSRSTTPTGGAEIVLFELSPHIGREHRPTIITGDFGQDHRIRTSHTQLISSLQLTHQHPIIQLIKFWKALREANSDIYIESVFGKTVFMTWLFCKIYKKKFVYMTASDRECDRKNIRNSPFFGRLFNIALEHADSIVISVKHHEQLLRTHHPAISCPIVYIPHGMSRTHTNTPIEKKKYILWLSRCDSWKNPELFIELARQFPKEQFVMIASLQSSQKELFKKVLSSAQATPNITFIPGIPHHQTHTYFNQAKILVSTSDFEGFSMAFMQSGFAGTPVLTLNLNPDSIITDHNLGYCAHGNFELMKRQLQALLDPQDIRTKSENITQYMNDHYDIQEVAKQWDELFARMFAS